VAPTPEFLGPFYISNGSCTDYYFICRLTFAGNHTDAEYVAGLTFDGEVDRSLPEKTTTASEPDVTFSSSDFGEHFGQQVTNRVI